MYEKPSPSGKQLTPSGLELLRDPAWSQRVAALPEAISLMRGFNLSPRERLF